MVLLYLCFQLNNQRLFCKILQAFQHIQEGELVRHARILNKVIGHKQEILRFRVVLNHYLLADLEFEASYLSPEYILPQDTLSYWHLGL